eukprot:462648-Pelagomonas_calceolata.AAC.1
MPELHGAKSAAESLDKLRSCQLQWFGLASLPPKYAPACLSCTCFVFFSPIALVRKKKRSSFVPWLVVLLFKYVPKSSLEEHAFFVLQSFFKCARRHQGSHLLHSGHVPRKWVFISIVDGDGQTEMK